MKKFVTILFVVLAMGLATGVVYAGLDYPDPASGWGYVYNGWAANPAVTTSLDGTWDHKDAGSGGSDAWDGSSIGMAGSKPGGVSVLSETITSGTYLTYLRLQDTGDPRDYGMSDPSNRKLYFGHSITNEIGALGDAILDTGVTISFRARIPTSGLLDSLHPDGGGGITPYPAAGDGYVIHDGGKGNFGVRQMSGDKTISFCLALATDDTGTADEMAGRQGLVMNKLNGTAVTGNVDMQGDEAGTVNILELDPIEWHEFWITIQADTTGTGTHLVTVSVDGSLVQNKFYVTAGDGNEYNDSYIAMGLGSTPQSGALDIDFFAYAPGVIPVPEPATIALLGLGGLALLGIRKKR